MEKRSIYQKIANSISAQKTKSCPFVVGINGIDGSGKTQFSKMLSTHLPDSVCIHIDDFHHPKKHRYQKGELSPKSYYQNSLNYEAFVQKTLYPLQSEKSFPISITSKIFDLDKDQDDVRSINILRDNIIILEGVFLFRLEIAPYLDLKIFIECHIDTAIERMKHRDADNSSKAMDAYEQRVFQKYSLGQDLYFHDVSPKSMADIIIDNNDFNDPKIAHIKEKRPPYIR